MEMVQDLVGERVSCKKFNRGGKSLAVWDTELEGGRRRQYEQPGGGGFC